MTKNTALSWVIIRWQALWQLWAGVIMHLFWMPYSFARLPVTWGVSGYLVLVISIRSLFIALLGLLLKPEPLAVCLDYRTGLVTCYQPKWPWRQRLPISQIRCQLSAQSSHKGNTHFLVVSGPHGQAWNVQEGNSWPLNRLKQLQELLTLDVAK